MQTFEIELSASGNSAQAAEPAETSGGDRLRHVPLRRRGIMLAHPFLDNRRDPRAPLAAVEEAVMAQDREGKEKWLIT